jgi:hypothetical protein
MGFALAGDGFADHCRRIAVADPKLRRSRNGAISSLSVQRGLANRNIAAPLVIGFVGRFVHKDDLRHSEVLLAQSLPKTF